MAAAHFLKPLLSGSPDGYILANARDGAPFATALETAFDSATRRRGLLGRDGLADGAALIIAPCQAIHTFAMKFPIDVVFVTGEGEVVKLRERMPAGRMAGAWTAFAVIELAAGAIARAGLKTGDRLALAPRITE
jgi:uncharacterized protein